MTRALLSLWREYRKEYKARIKAGHENEAMDWLKEKRTPTPSCSSCNPTA